MHFSIWEGFGHSFEDSEILEEISVDSLRSSKTDGIEFDLGDPFCLFDILDLLHASVLIIWSSIRHEVVDQLRIFIVSLSRYLAGHLQSRGVVSIPYLIIDLCVQVVGWSCLPEDNSCVMVVVYASNFVARVAGLGKGLEKFFGGTFKVCPWLTLH